MAISSYSNPIPEIIDGLLRGHQLGLQMQQAARANEEFKTQQSMHNQQMSMQDIMNQHTMEEYGQPLGPGDTIKEHIQTPSTPFASASPAPSSGQEDLYNLPLKQPSPTMPGQSIDYLRKADKSRVATLQDRFGNKTSYETYTPEQRLQRAQSAAEAQNVIKAHGEELLKAAALRAEANQKLVNRQNELKLMPGGGIDAPAGIEAYGWRQGEKMTRGDVEDVTKRFMEANKPTMMGPGMTALLPNNPFATQAPQAPALTQPTAPSQPDQTTTTINIPGQIPGQTPAATPPTPVAPGGMRVVGSSPAKFDAKELFVKSMAKSLFNTTPENLTGPQMEEIQRREEATKFNPETKRHNLSMEENARINTGIRAGQLRQTQLVNGIEYGPETQDYWVKTLQENPDAVAAIPEKLKGAVGLRLRAQTGLPLPTKLSTTAQAQETAARNALDGLSSIQDILKDPGIRSQVGPILGRLGNVEQRAGTAIGLTPEQEAKAQELRTRMRYFVLQEGKALMGGRIVSKIQDQLTASSPRVDMDAPMLEGAIKGAADNAQTILDNTDKQRFGGKMRSREMRGAGPRQGGKMADATIIKQYLDAAGGDKNKARQALGAAGYTIPGAQ